MIRLKKYSLFLALCATLLHFTSCKYEGCRTGMRSCMNGFINTEFNGFDSTEVDTIYIIRFERGGNFVHVKDTSLVIPYPSSGNFLVSAHYGYFPIDAYYDSEIIIPGLKTVKISDIQIQRESCCNCSSALTPAGWVCPVISFRQDSVLINATGSDSTGLIKINK